MLLNIRFASKTAPRGGKFACSNQWFVFNFDTTGWVFAQQGCGSAPKRNTGADVCLFCTKRFDFGISTHAPFLHHFLAHGLHKKKSNCYKTVALVVVCFAPRGGKISLVVAIVACCTATCTVRGSDLAFWAVRRGCPFPPLRPCGLPQFCRRVER